MPLFGELENLQELKQLENVRGLEKLDNLDKLDNLQKLDQLQQLDKLDNLNQLQQLDKLDQLQGLNQLQQMQSMEQLQHLDKLQNLDKLNNIQGLQNLELLKELQRLEQLQGLQRLEQLQLLQRLEKLEDLNKLAPLQKMDNLTNLNQLDNLHYLTNADKLSQLANLSQLDKLNQLEPLDKLQTVDRAWNINYSSLLYLASTIVPGLIFQETVSVFLKERLGFKRALVLMAVYNVLTIFVCLQFVYNRLNTDLLNSDPLYYYGAWSLVILVLPFVLGWLVAFLINHAPLGEHLRHFLISAPAQAAANAWDRFLTEAESYQIVITLKDNKKILGTFHKGMPVPDTQHPNDLFLRETSVYDPDADQWQDLERPIGTWVRGTEIKMVEVTPHP